MKIEIQEVRNGFVVSFFDEHGPSDLDYEIYCKDIPTVFLEFDKWVKSIKKSREKKEVKEE